MAENNLAEGSRSYHDNAHIYERFSQVEDAPGKILAFLKPRVEGKDVLDLGCGTGKYLERLAPIALSYRGLDISPDQLAIARQKACAKFLCSSAESIDLPDESIDAAISTWVIGTIQGVDRRTKALSEATRVLRREGSIYLVENDLGGEFEYIRGRYPDIARTKEYNDWLEQEMGFVPVSKFSTYFDFKSLDEAKAVFGVIWGKEATQRVSRRDVEQRIVIYQKKK